ncbi:MAG: toll/interleukin-1 receptor domain-containing protein [Chloroflexaceae bacterium]|nr:toll/interleukin-1 receptor domain-containing protein [Chloroflexaceae bacterium]
MNSLEIYNILVQSYSDEEFNHLCYYHFRPVFERFAAGMTRTQKIQELIDYCERHGEEQTLVERLRQERPNRFPPPSPAPMESMESQEPPGAAGDHIDARYSQGFVNRSTGPVHQQFGGTHHHYYHDPSAPASSGAAPAPSGSAAPAPPATTAPPSRRMMVFLSYAPDDLATVQSLYRKLQADGFQPWMDREDLLPGQNWQREIERAIRQSGAVVICLSSRAVTKSGQFHRQMNRALDVYEEQPDGTIYLIPLKLDPCDLPDRLRPLLHEQLELVFDQGGYEMLRRALQSRAETYHPR